MELPNKEKNQEENIELSTKSVQSAFDEVLDLGKYKFKLKRIKGKELFKLVSVFGFSNGNMEGKTEEEIFKTLMINMGDNFDYAMQNLKYSIDGTNYFDLVINGIYQVADVEEDVSIMMQLVFFVFKCTMLFMQLSQ